MKKLTEPYEHVGHNAWGATSRQTIQEFEVEATDVGVTRADYLGRGHRFYKFTAADVGRTISDHGHCWTFGSFSEAAAERRSK